MARNRMMSLQNAKSDGPQSSLLGRHDDNGAPATVRSPVAAQQDASAARVLWAYVRHELLYICWALMDIALIAPLALGFISWTRGLPLGAFVAWLFLVLLIPFNLSRLMSIAGVELRRQRNWIMISFALAFFLGVRSFLFQPQSLFDFSWLGALAGRMVNQPGQLWLREVALFILLAILWARGLALTGRYVARDRLSPAPRRPDLRSHHYHPQHRSRDRQRPTLRYALLPRRVGRRRRLSRRRGGSAGDGEDLSQEPRLGRQRSSHQSLHRVRRCPRLPSAARVCNCSRNGSRPCGTPSPLPAWRSLPRRHT